MEYSPELLKQFAEMCGIPTVHAAQRIWIVRTKGGRYYQDFSLNGFIALGWDKIPLTSGAEDAAILLERKKAECNEIVRAADERQKKLAPIMESMGLQPPLVELPNNIIMFPLRAKEPNDE